MRFGNMQKFIGLGLILLLSGCATLDRAKSADQYRYENAMLKKKLEKLKKEKDEEIARLKSENQQQFDQALSQKDKQLTDLEKAKIELENRLQNLINEYQVKLKMTERGLVVTFLSEIFFDSGKDVISPEGGDVLKKVARVLNENVPNANVAVEGHADNVPIGNSGWKSNWELSSARALAVVHLLIGQGKVAPQRLSANGYGEYRPVKTNATAEGRRQNRRVEIVILPENLKKVYQ